MAQMTASQIAIELQRKKAAGQKTASDPANQAALDKLFAQPAAGATAQPSGVGVRDFLNQNGIKDIGFDNNTKSVTVGGQSFIKPSSISKGTAYASNDALTSALVGLQNRQSQQKVKGLMGQVETAINTPYKAPEFNYSPETDPQYIAALSRAKANAQTASGNAMAELNKRGILNSTITGDRLGQIEQAEYGRVSDELVPQLMQQAYGRYRDSVNDGYRTSRDTIGDLATLLGLESDTNQRNLDNYNTDRTYNRGVLESDRTFNRNNLESDRNFNRGVLESDRGFNRGVLESDRGFNRGVLESDRNYNRGVTESDRNFDQNNSQFWANYNQNADQFNRTLDSKNAADAPKDTYTPTQIGDIITQNFKDSFDNTFKSDQDRANAASFIIDSVSDANQALQIARANGLTEDEFMKVLEQKAKENQSGN